MGVVADKSNMLENGLIIRYDGLSKYDLRGGGKSRRRLIWCCLPIRRKWGLRALQCPLITTLTHQQNALVHLGFLRCLHAATKGKIYVTRAVEITCTKQSVKTGAMRVFLIILPQGVWKWCE
jgi:hypothetical protein